MVTSVRHRARAKQRGLKSRRHFFRGHGLDHQRWQSLPWKKWFTIGCIAMLVFNISYVSSYYLSVRRVDHVGFVEGHGLMGWRFPRYPVWQEGSELFYLPIHHIDRSVVRPGYW